MKTDRYLRACHRVQTALAFMINLGKYTGAEPKHLRVGINLQKAEFAGLAKLLVDKGVITADELGEALIEAVEKEADDLSTELEALLGRPVKTL